MSAIACVDIGSTYTKAALVGLPDGELRATAQSPTTLDDVVAGVLAATDGWDAPVTACSSAGGGLRLAVVGYEELISAEAGHRAALSAGARVVHVAAGRLDDAALGRLAAAASAASPASSSRPAATCTTRAPADSAARCPASALISSS